LEALVPILVRPVREQLEHDRIIRLLEAKWRRKFKVDANPGDERNAGVKVPAGTLYPDLVLTEEGGRKPKALIEVETNESVNHLEAMAQWANLAKSRTSLILFVPVGAVEAARRLSNENAIKLSELWTYHVLGDQVRFTSVFRERGLEPADLIEKAEVFTTERAAPAPRPVPVEPVEPAAPPPAPQPERPRKLAVKAGSRPAVADGAVSKVVAALGKVAAKVANRIAPKGGASVAAPEPPKAPAAVTVRPPASKTDAKAPAPAKPVPPARTAAPKPPDKPEKSLSEKAAARPVAKIGEKPADRPAEKHVAKPVEKPVAKKAAAKPEVKPEVKKAVAKAAPVKVIAGKPVVAKKPAPKIAAPRPVARKIAAPVRPPARPTSAKKAAPVPAAKSRPSKRK
jgi:hypothetical protein